jgi:hypothetical protein
MSHHKKSLVVALLAAAVLAAPACKSKPKVPPPPTSTNTTVTPTTPSQAVSVVNVAVGRAIGIDKRVTSPVDTFSPNDTIYASVETQGASPSTTLSARWTFQDGQTVSEETQSIAPTGPAITEFHVSKPDGLPPGSYKVEIMLDGASVRTATFKVS